MPVEPLIRLPLVQVVLAALQPAQKVQTQYSALLLLLAEAKLEFFNLQHPTPQEKLAVPAAEQPLFNREILYLLAL